MHDDKQHLIVGRVCTLFSNPSLARQKTVQLKIYGIGYWMFFIQSCVSLMLNSNLAFHHELEKSLA